MATDYRRMPEVLGEAERADEAVRVLGVWREYVRTLTLFAGTMVCHAVAGLAYWMMRALDAELVTRALVATAAWIAAFVITIVLSGAIVRWRAPNKFVELARAYETPIEQIKSRVTA